MRTIDFRDRRVPSEHEPERTYVALADDATYLFRFGAGNLVPWDELEPFLLGRLPGGFHAGLGDLSVGAADVVVDGRAGDGDAHAWLCSRLMDRGILSPSVPVTVAYPSGYREELGPLGCAARLEVPAYA